MIGYWVILTALVQLQRLYSAEWDENMIMNRE
jgi:hypothetical protein